MDTEGVPRTLELSGKYQGISLCLESGQPGRGPCSRVSKMTPMFTGRDDR